MKLNFFCVFPSKSKFLFLPSSGFYRNNSGNNDDDGNDDNNDDGNNDNDDNDDYDSNDDGDDASEIFKYSQKRKYKIEEQSLLTISLLFDSFAKILFNCLKFFSVWAKNFPMCFKEVTQ